MADETPWTPVGKEPVDDQGWVPVAPPESGYIAGGLRSIYRGLTEIPRAAGDALEYNPEYLASGDSTATRDASKLSFLDKAGKVLSDVSESAKEVVAPAVYGTDEIKRSVFQGVESAPLSLAYKIPGYVGAVAAGALGSVTGPGSLLTAAAGAAVAQAPVAAVMYRATAQQNMEDLDKAQSEGTLKPGTTNAQKLATAQAMAHQEWIGEGVSDIATNVMFSKLPFLGAAVKSAKGVLTPGLKSFAKTYAGVWVAEQTGEGYTAATQAALKNEILPDDQQQTPWEAAKYQAGPTTVMTLLFTGAGHAGSSFKGRGVTKYLEDDNTPADVRFQLASIVANRLKESNGPETARNFMEHAADAIANKSAPYRLDLNDPALLTPYKPVDEAPATPLEQSGQDALDALKARVNPDNDIGTTDDAVAHVEEVKSAQTEAELNLQTATENLVKKMNTPTLEPVIPEPAPPEPVTPQVKRPEDMTREEFIAQHKIDEPFESLPLKVREMGEEYVDSVRNETYDYLQPFNPLKVYTTSRKATDYQRATGDTAYEVVRKDGKFVFEKTLETLKAEGYATTPSGNPFTSKAAAEKRIDLEQYEAVPFKKGWIGKPKTFLHQADVHAEELAKTLVEGGIGQDNSGQREAAAQVKRPEPVTPEPVSKPEAEAAFNKEYTARLLKGDFRGAFEKHSDDMIDDYAADPANQAVFNMNEEDLAEYLTTLADGVKERASKNVKFAVKGNENVSADKRGLSDGVLRGDADVGTQGTRSVATQGVEKGSPDTVEGRTLVEASIKRSIATHAGTTPEAVQLSLVPNVGNYKVANAIARLFGKYVYTADTAEDASLGDAFVSGSHPDAIFISKNTDKPVFTLLGHELLHKLAAENSELYNKFKLYIEANNKSSVAEKYKAGLKKISQYSTLDDTGITEEYLGNVVGHMFVQQSFWEKLARTEPTLFARILNILRDMLQTIKSNFQGAASTLKDVNEAETVTAKVFAKYARLYSEGKFSVDITNPDMKFSASEKLTKDIAWTTPQQRVSSGSTSISYPNPEAKAPIIFSAFRDGKISLGPKNADIGGGRYNQITDWLNGKGVDNVVWDRFNRGEAHNDNAYKELAGGQADTATVSNVLNVIPDELNRAVVIATAHDSLKVGGKAYFSMYNAPNPGEVVKRDAFQVGRPAAAYIGEIEAVFGEGNVTQKGQIVVATKGEGMKFSAASEAGATTEGQKEKAAKMWAEMGVESPFFKKWFGKSKVVDGEGKPLVVYHGTSKVFYTFKNQDTAYGFFFTADKGAADFYNTNDAGETKEVYLKMEKPADFDDYATFDKIAQEAVWSDATKPTEEAFALVTKQIAAWGVNDPVVGGIAQDYIFKDRYGAPEYGNLEDFIDEIRDAYPEQAQKIDDFLSKKENQHNPDIDEARRVYEDEPQNWYMNYQDDFVKAAENLGYDGVITSDARGGGGVDTSYIVFSPTQIKSATGNRGTFDATNPDIRFSGGKNVTTNKGVAGDTNFHLRPASERLAAINGAVEYPDGSKIPQGSLKVSKNSTLQNQLSKIAGVFGHDVTLVADFPGRRGDGFWYSADTKHVYIYETGADKPLAVLGHELVHHMQTQDNALYKELGAGFFALRDNAGMNKYLDRYFPGVDKSSVPKGITEEWVGDVLGRSMGDQGFWDAFEKASPSLAARVARFIHELIQKVKGKLFSGRIAGSAQTVKDFKAVDELAADVMTRYASRMEKAAASGEGVKFSAGDVGRFSASLNDPIKAAKGLNDFFRKIPYSQIATDAANKIYRFVIPVDRQVTLNASQKTYAPIKSLLNQFIRQRKEKAGRIQSDMTDGAHIWKRFEKQFKTDAEVQNFSDMVWNATEYELHADPAIASPWNERSWEASGMLKKTGKTLEEAQKIVSDQYRKLTPEQKTVHLEMLHHVQQMYQAGRQAELAWLDPAKVKEAEAWLQDEVGNTFNKVEKPELVDLVRDIDEHYPTLRGDYMPMMRFGDLIVRTYETDKNGELVARTRTDFFNSPEDARKFIEAVNSNNTSYQNELKAAGDDAVAQAAVREKYKDYNLKHAKIETNPEYRKDVVNIPASLVDKISKAAANQGITGDALEELKQSIEGIRANLLPRTSTKSSKLHREGVAGYEKDVIRVYLTYVRNHALANAQLTHGAKIEQTFRDMRNKIDAVASEPDYDVDAVRRMGELADHLYGIEKSGSREKVNEFTKTVGKITFAWYLASPSVFAVQWSQPFMVTIPKMGARHGYGKAFAAYTKAAKQYLHGEFSDDKIDEFDRKHEYVGQRVTDILDRSRDARGAERVQLDKELKEIYNLFKDVEKRLLILKVLSHQGQIDLAMAHNAGDVVAGATADTKALNWIVGKGAFFMQKSETGSRRAAAISAFELQFNGNNFTEANDYATHIISDTLMDFDAQNRGAAWRGNTGRIIGQFQFFRMHMVGKLAQLTKDAIGGEYKRAMAEATTQEEKDAAMKAMKEARKEFAFVMGSSFALAGALGTPLAVLMGNTGMSALWAALAAVFGDDDDPWDPKRDFELAVRDALGDTFGNVVLKGLPSLIGADLSRRIGLGGMGDIIQGDPPAGLTPTAKANWYAGRILGPSWGVMADTIRSADALADGDLAGAFKAGSPKIMRDVAKMFSVANKGVEAGGKTILKPEDVSVWSMALMFSGINPMEVALAGEESRYLKNISTELSQRRSMLIKHLAEATVDQDLDAKEVAIEKINKFSETQPMLKITQQELVRKIKKIRDGREGKLSKREMLIQEEFGKK